jgi:hypothetical protein
MAAYLASPPSTTLQPPSGDCSVVSGLGSTCPVGSVIGGDGVHVSSSALPMGGPGVPGGTSAPLVGLLGRRPDPDDGALAPGSCHHNLGVPPSLGGVGIHTGVSGLDMGGLGVPLFMSLSVPTEICTYHTIINLAKPLSACYYKGTHSREEITQTQGTTQAHLGNYVVGT